jgi:hypothetical protein
MIDRPVHGPPVGGLRNVQWYWPLRQPFTVTDTVSSLQTRPVSSLQTRPVSEFYQSPNLTQLVSEPNSSRC